MSEIRREITDHKINGLNNCIRIEAVGEPGAGGANTHYTLALVDGERPPIGGCDDHWVLSFQEGNPAKYVNGLSTEALLAVAIDRIRGHQGLNPLVDGGMELRARPLTWCDENDHALSHAMECLFWLQKRTRDRQARGVEGQQKA